MLPRIDDHEFSSDWRLHGAAAIERLARDCAQADWDAYGAKPVTAETREAASALLAKLPGGIPEPEIGADPDGEIAFEWELGPELVFSVSVRGGDKRLSYAGLYGRSKVHGTEFLGEAIPDPITLGIGRLLRAR